MIRNDVMKPNTSLLMWKNKTNKTTWKRESASHFFLPAEVKHEQICKSRWTETSKGPEIPLKMKTALSDAATSLIISLLLCRVSMLGVRGGGRREEKHQKRAGLLQGCCDTCCFIHLFFLRRGGGSGGEGGAAVHSLRGQAWQ